MELKKWMVGLDMSITDYMTIRNVKKLAQGLKPEEIHFVHVHKKADIPEFMFKEIPDLIEPEISFIKNILTEKIMNEGLDGIKYKLEVVVGNVLAELLQYAKNEDIDMVVMAQKIKGSHSGVIFRKMVRKSPCSVLVLPDRAVDRFSKVMVPVDFSTYSQSAVDIACHISKQFEADQIEVHHIFKDAENYLNETLHTTHEVEEFLTKKGVLNEKLEQHAKFQLEKFIKGLPDFGMEIKGSLSRISKSQTIAETTIEHVKRSHPDLLVVGAKGQSTAPAFLLGSVAESICRLNVSYPMLVVKRKGENVGLIESLLSIVKSS